MCFECYRHKKRPANFPEETTFLELPPYLIRFTWVPHRLMVMDGLVSVYRLHEWYSGNLEPMQPELLIFWRIFKYELESTVSF